MKTFLVHFKNGDEVKIKAEGFANNMNTGSVILFYGSGNKPDYDIYVATDEVLYVVPEPSPAEGESK
jgi:hypothetical protein